MPVQKKENHGLPPRPTDEEITTAETALRMRHENPEKEFLMIFRRLTYVRRPWEVWKDFITVAACSISNAVDKRYFDDREDLYMRTILKYTKTERNLFPELLAKVVMALEVNPEQDFLGELYMKLGLGNDSGGQFFTPYDVCQLMAEVTMGGDILGEVREKGYISMCDPCCGAGATLIAGIHEARRKLERDGLNFQNHILVLAQEIDFTTALMCYIQISFLGMAGYVKIGNTLTEPMSETDTLESYWFTPVYFTEIWATRRIFEWDFKRR